MYYLKFFLKVFIAAFILASIVTYLVFRFKDLDYKPCNSEESSKVVRYYDNLPDHPVLKTDRRWV